jgi:hypothetical protein
MKTVVPRRVGPPEFRTTTLLISIEALWTKIARRRFLSCALVAAVCIALRLALLPVDPIPYPKIHDEFSYLLGADTLAKGRLATPTHPLWRFLESYHINMQPTYVSKYPPGQAAFLALGIRLFGHPWYGVLISVALMCGCICWALQAWVPAKYALLGGLLAVLWLGTTYYWTDSYWGGAVAGIGGALVFGALPRLARHGKTSAAYAAAIGVAILANSRPFEGLVFVLLSFAGLLWWTRGRLAIWLRPAVVAPFGLILLSTAAWIGYYNFKTTGSPTVFAYSIYQEHNAASPLLWIMPPYPQRGREYRDPSMRVFWESTDFGIYTRTRHNPIRALFGLYAGIGLLLGTGAGLVLLFLFACAVPLAGMPRPRLAFGVVLLFVCALTLNKYVQAHYMAPALGAFLVLAMFGFRLLHSYRVRGQRTGQGIAASVVALAVLLFLFDTTVAIVNGRHLPVGVSAFRQQVLEKLGSEPGMHLVLVHYDAKHHDALAEIVYNGADIDAQKTVWAFDFGHDADRPLLDYYRDRKVWLVQPDGPDPSIEPYAAFVH